MRLPRKTSSLVHDYLKPERNFTRGLRGRLELDRIRNLRRVVFSSDSEEEWEIARIRWSQEGLPINRIEVRRSRRDDAPPVRIPAVELPVRSGRRGSPTSHSVDESRFKRMRKMREKQSSFTRNMDDAMEKGRSSSTDSVEEPHAKSRRIHVGISPRRFDEARHDMRDEQNGRNVRNSPRRVNEARQPDTMAYDVPPARMGPYQFPIPNYNEEELARMASRRTPRKLPRRAPKKE